MAIGLMNFPILSPEQANPLGYGIGQGQDMLRKYLEAQKSKIEMPFLQPKLQEQLKELQIKNQYSPEIYQSEAASKKANAVKAQAIADILTAVLSKKNPVQQQGSSTTLDSSNRPGITNFPLSQPNQMFGQNPQESMQQGMQIPGSDQAYPTQLGSNDQIGEIAASLLGLKPFTAVENGRLITKNPLTGQVSFVKVGPNIKEQELEKSDAQTISELEKSSIAASNLQPIIDNLASITSNPIFQRMRNLPAAPSYELAYYRANGSPEERELLGTFTAQASKFVSESAKTFGPRMTNTEFNFVRQMKINDKDTLESAQGKLKAIDYLNQVVQKRDEMAAELMRSKNMSPLQAFKKAKESINTDKIIKDLEKKYIRKDYRKIKLKNPDTGETKLVSLDEAKELVSPEEFAKLKKFGIGG